MKMIKKMPALVKYAPGPGPMGFFCLQYVKANGGKVILTGRETDARRLELGKQLGAD